MQTMEPQRGVSCHASVSAAALRRPWQASLRREASGPALACDVSKTAFIGVYWCETVIIG